MNPQTIILSFASIVSAIPQFGYGMGYGMGMMNPMMMGGMFWDEKTHQYVKGSGTSTQQTQQQHK
jgi:hypothetical protein